MRKLFLLFTVVAISSLSMAASTNTLAHWTFNDGTLLADPVTISTNDPVSLHLGGVDTNSNAYIGWEERKDQGAALVAPAAGTVNFGATWVANTSKYYGPINMVQGSNQTTNSPYVYAIGSDEIARLTVKIDRIDFTSAPANGGNAAFGLRLWDFKESSWIGITIQDRNNGNHGNTDRLEVNVQSTASTLTGGGIAGNNSNWQRVAWITDQRTGADDLSSLLVAEDVTYVLELNYSAGTWEVFINGVSEQTGTFDKSKVTGFDRLQAAFGNFINGDYVTVDEIKIESISPDAPALEPLSGWYYSSQNGVTSLYEASDGYNQHTNGNMAIIFNDVVGQSTWDYNSDPVIQAGSENFFAASSDSVPGTNATQITSIWKANTTGTVQYWNNVGGQVATGDSIFIAPGANDNLKLKSQNTELIIDSPVSLASLSGEAAGATTLTVTNGGSLVVRGNSPLVSTTGSGSGLTYMDNQIQVGAYGTGPGTHSMVLNVKDGGSIDTGRISLGHSRASGILNVDGGSVNVDNSFWVGYDANSWGTGVVNLVSGTIDATNTTVGLRGPGEINISGGSYNPTGYLRVSSTTSNATEWVNAQGTINVSGGALNLGSDLYIGYNSATGDTYVANVNVSGGQLNANENTIDVGRISEGILTISGSGEVNVVNDNINIGQVAGASGTLIMDGGTLNMTIENDYTNSYPTLTIGGWNGGTGHLAINDGTINLDGNFYQNNISPSGGLTPTVATAEQTGGTFNTLGGEFRIGNNGPATYLISGGVLDVNADGLSTNSRGAANSNIILSHGPFDSSLTIQGGLVHTKQIGLESTPENGHVGAQATLNLDGGTLLLEANWTGAINIKDDADINISSGALIWAGGGTGKVEHVKQNLAPFINLTGGLLEVPEGNYNPVLTNNNNVLMAEVYNVTNKPAPYAAELYTDIDYTRFVSVQLEAVSPDGYEAWLTAYGIDLSAADDGDGRTLLMEYALDTSPTVDDPSGITHALSSDATSVTFTHPKRAGTDHGLVYTLQTSDTLINATWSDYATVAPENADESVTHTILIGSDVKKYIRLKVEEVTE